MSLGFGICLRLQKDSPSPNLISSRYFSFGHYPNVHYGNPPIIQFNFPATAHYLYSNTISKILIAPNESKDNTVRFMNTAKISSITYFTRLPQKYLIRLLRTSLIIAPFLRTSNLTIKLNS